MSTYTWSNTSSNSGVTGHFTWVVPTGEQVTTIQTWGGGAGGGSVNTGNGNGGGGGGYSEKDGLTIAAGTTLYLRVGPQGAGSDANSNAAGDAGQTWVASSNPGNDFNPPANSCLCRAVGGSNGDGSGTGSGGSEGSTAKQFTGGNGGSPGGFGGPGGGSSAGTATGGNNGADGPGSPSAGGAGGSAPTGGGAGGSGASLGGSGSNGSSPSAGGGAADSQGLGNPAGNGADGQIIIITSTVSSSSSVFPAVLMSGKAA
jgi:hypothetical protein